MTTSLGPSATGGVDLALTATSEPTPTVFIVGAGLVGASLSANLVRVGVPVLGIHGRSRPGGPGPGACATIATSGEFPAALSDAEIVIIAVKDARVPEIAKRLVDEARLRPKQVVLQTSGSRSSEELLAGARSHVAGIGTMHPLVAISAGPLSLGGFAGAAFGVEGDEPARGAAAFVAGALGARPMSLRSDGMALYHAGAVIASNALVSLVALARAVLVAAGVAESDALPALMPLVSSAVRNLRDVGLPGALTGPVVRGDVVSVERHVGALHAHVPEVLEVYRRLGRETLRLARQQRPDELDAAAVARMSALFDGEPVGRPSASVAALR